MLPSLLVCTSLVPTLKNHQHVPSVVRPCCPSYRQL